MVAKQQGAEGPANRCVDPGSSVRVRGLFGQLLEGAGFFNFIRKLKTYFVNLASDDVLEGVDILKNIHERSALTPGRHIEIGPVRARRLMAVR
jgi:hypothetical protein